MKSVCALILILACSISYGKEPVAAEKALVPTDLNFKSKTATRAVKRYQIAKKKIDKTYKIEKEKVLLDLIKDLEKELSTSTRSGNLKEAIEISDAISALKKNAPVKKKKSKKKARVYIPKSAVTWGKHHYLVVPSQLTVEIAKKRCKARGGHLVLIESEAENSFVKKLVGQQATYVWIDGSDEDKEGVWKSHDGKRLKFTKWARIEPNNNAPGGEHHIIMEKTGQWLDTEGSKTFIFVCEWDQ